MCKIVFKTQNLKALTNERNWLLILDGYPWIIKRGQIFFVDVYLIKVESSDAFILVVKSRNAIKLGPKVKICAEVKVGKGGRSFKMPEFERIKSKFQTIFKN